MTPSGLIDSVRYPNFARLASEASWYPRATTVHDHTTGSIPAMLTGKRPSGTELPTLADHPDNLFTLLGENYAVRAHENVTYLCPKRYCARAREALTRRLGGLASDVRIAFLRLVLPRSLSNGLPDIGDRWEDFNRDRLLVATSAAQVDGVVVHRPHKVEQQIDAVLRDFERRGSSGTLFFAHVMLPHGPYEFLPSGEQYNVPAVPEGRLGTDAWTPQPWPVLQAYQRHLLQLGYTDAFLGRLLVRMERAHLYDKALMIVTADHGVSFVPGGSPRWTTPRNIADISRVPLFVKLPGQRVGHVDRRAALTIDILPTIADVLGAHVPWAIDGHSLLGPPNEPSRVIVAKPARSAGLGTARRRRPSDGRNDPAQDAALRRRSTLAVRGRISP